MSTHRTSSLARAGCGLVILDLASLTAHLEPAEAGLFRQKGRAVTGAAPAQMDLFRT